MAPKKTRLLRIHRRDYGKFVTRNETDTDTDTALGVDASLAMAAGTAHREAIAINKADRCSVRVEIEQMDGSWKVTETVKPPN